MLKKQAGPPVIYGVERLWHNKSDLFGIAEHLLWRVSMELEPYLAIFKVPDALEFRYTRDFSLAELVELERHFGPEAGFKPGRSGNSGFLSHREQ